MRENLLTLVEAARGPDGSGASPGRDRPDFEALGQLVAEIAHEARNPLASILVGLEAWSEEPDAPFDLYGTRIQREAGRLSRLMDCLLELARPTRERCEPVQLQRLIEDAVTSAALALQASGVELETEICAGGATVQGDPAALARVLQNLLDNAIQHAPAGSVVRISLTVDGNAAVWIVKDRGPGFEADDLRRAFAPFFSRRRGGAGLGLAIVQKIVDGHGGTVTLTNRCGGGARAIVRLPAAGSAV